MASNRHTTPPGANGQTPKGRLVLPEKVVRKLKPHLLRVVVAMAKEEIVEDIAKAENISVNGVRKRFDRVHKVLGKKTSIGVYRILLMADLIRLE